MNIMNSVRLVLFVVIMYYMIIMNSVRLDLFVVKIVLQSTNNQLTEKTLK